MKSRLATALLCAVLAACGGIPLQSLPKLMKLQSELLEADPAEFMVAIQVDARMLPPAGAVPVLELAIRPAEPGAFEPIDRKLPMQSVVVSGPSLGLAKPSADRRWLVYSLPPASQTELRRIQNDFRRIQAERQGKRGGSVSVGIAQDGVAVRDPLLAPTRWESWLQTSRREGFYELWSGSVGELLRRADEAARKAPKG